MSKYYTTDKVDAFAAAGSVDQSSLGNNELVRHAEESAEVFRSTGFPTIKHEDWKYTNLKPLLQKEFSRVSREDVINSTRLTSLENVQAYAGSADRLIFLDGHYRADLSTIGELPEGVLLCSLAEAIENHTDLLVEHIGNAPESFQTPFTYLNSAHLADGLFLWVPASTQLPRPVHALFLGDGSDGPTVSYPRLVVVVGKSSSATLLEEYRGLENRLTMTNAVGEFSIGENAQFHHTKVQEESKESFHIAASHATLGRNALYQSNAMIFGARLSRNDPSALLTGDGGHAALDGLYIAEADQTLDAHTSIDHVAANCTSHELYKGILKESGHGVFNGKIFVREGAQKTDSVQSNMNLLLSDEAAIDTKPQLEIFADDVKCTHGATIGRLDDASIFYLRSRGVGLEDARKMLTYAFAAEVVEHLQNDEIAAYVTSILDRRLEH